MCVRTGKVPAFECCVGDLKPGQEYHDPNGERWMVLDLPKVCPISGPNSVMVVNIGNAGGGYNPYGRQNDEYKGSVRQVYEDVKLGRDEKGRLYASTALNEWNLYPEDLAQAPADSQVSLAECLPAPEPKQDEGDRIDILDNLW